MAKKKRKKLTRKELKRDVFTETLINYWVKVKHTPSMLVYPILGIVAVIALGIYLQRAKQHRISQAYTLYFNGQYYYISNDFDNAESQWKRLIDTYPNHAIAQRARYFLGNIAYFRGKYEEACTYYEELLQNCKDKELRAAAIMGIADCYLAENDPISAKEEYLELVDKYPESVLAPYALYRAALCVADTNERNHILRRLLEEYPRSNYAKLIRARYPGLGLSRE